MPPRSPAARGPAPSRSANEIEPPRARARRRGSGRLFTAAGVTDVLARRSGGAGRGAAAGARRLTAGLRPHEPARHVGPPASSRRPRAAGRPPPTARRPAAAASPAHGSRPRRPTSGRRCASPVGRRGHAATACAAVTGSSSSSSAPSAAASSGGGPGPGEHEPAAAREGRPAPRAASFCAVTTFTTTSAGSSSRAVLARVPAACRRRGTRCASRGLEREPEQDQPEVVRFAGRAREHRQWAVGLAPVMGPSPSSRPRRSALAKCSCTMDASPRTQRSPSSCRYGSTTLRRRASTSAMLERAVEGGVAGRRLVEGLKSVPQPRHDLLDGGCVGAPRGPGSRRRRRRARAARLPRPTARPPGAAASAPRGGRRRRHESRNPPAVREAGARSAAPRRAMTRLRRRRAG